MITETPNVVFRKLRSGIARVQQFHQHLNFRREKPLARTYLEEAGVISFLKTGNEAEYTPNYYDLANLHRIIRQRRPQVIVEFGVGFSTIAMAHALYLNFQSEQKENGEKARKGKIFTVDTSEQWTENCRSKLPDELRDYSDIRCSPVHTGEIDGQPCHYFDSIPNVVPDFVYLDGPHSSDVMGNVHGLEFGNQVEFGPQRRVVAADMISYESTLAPGFIMVVDKRSVNVEFLRNNLRRKYVFHRDFASGVCTFELIE